MVSLLSIPSLMQSLEPLASSLNRETKKASVGLLKSRLHRLGISFMLITTGFVSSPALSQSSDRAGRLQMLKPLAVARASEALIKIYDPKVRSVRLVAPAGPGTTSACGITLKDENGEAFYCAKDRTIYISKTTLNEIADRFGIAAAAAVVAHEFGHARQHALTGFLSTIVWTNAVDELQADCIAGVYMREATPIKLSDAQNEQVKALMENLGNYEFLMKKWQGTPQMRVMAYSLGYQGGSLSTCAASESFNWNQLIEGNPSGLKEWLQQIRKMVPSFE